MASTDGLAALLKMPGAVGRFTLGRAAWALAAAGALGLVAQVAAAQVAAGRPTFRSEVDVVTVAVVVSDRAGRPVRNLSADDFVVLDGGVERRIVECTSGDAEAVTLALLVDESGSMAAGGTDAAARSVAVELVSALERSTRGRDEVAVYGFDSSVHERVPFTTDLDRARAALGERRSFGATSVYDAVASVARGLAARGRATRALVVVTDGVDNRSRLRLEEVSGLASAIDVPVYVMEVGAASRQEAVAMSGGGGGGASATLGDLARWTGGARHVVPDEAGEIRQVAARVVSEIRGQYLVAFEAAEVPGWRPLEIRTRRPGLVVRARGAYLAGGSPAALVRDRP